MTNDQNPGATGVRMLANAALTALAHPPLMVNINRRATAPIVVSTRHYLGERYYYRLGGLVRFVTYAALLTPSTFPLVVYGGVVGFIGFLVGWAINWAALYWFWRCDRECRSEIAARRHSGAAVHSWSAGVPRFSLPNNESVNLRKIPAALFGLGVVVAPFTFAFGCYLCFCAFGIAAEGLYRRRLAREAALDEQDRRGERGDSVHQASLPAREFHGAANEQPVGSSPLDGFSEILSDSNP